MRSEQAELKAILVRVISLAWRFDPHFEYSNAGWVAGSA